MKRVVIIGGGVFGSMHAYFALKRGYQVIQCERDIQAQSASVRNFGLVWVSGRAAGPELELAIRSRYLWGEIGDSLGSIGFRSNGSLTIAKNEAELAIVAEAAKMDDARVRGFEALTRAEVQEIEPALNGNYLGALRCNLDAALEPELLFVGLRKYLLENKNYSWVNNFEVSEIKNFQDSFKVEDTFGKSIEGDQVFICTGAFHKGFLRDALKDEAIRRVRLQMGATEVLSIGIGHSLADGDSFRYYPAFKNLSLANLPPQKPIAKAKAMQLLAVQRLDGSVTIGDTHEYEEPFDHELHEEPYEHLREVLGGFLGKGSPKLVRRWEGIYSQVTSKEIYFRKEIHPGVEIVTGGGGRGNTLAPAIAEESFK